jgi:hypothetical protein
MTTPNSTEEITKLMDTYKKKMSQQETAEEMNRNTQHLYLYDYIYLFCKIFLFIILGVMYYLWVGNKEVAEAYENTKETVKVSVAKATEKIKEIRETKPSIPMVTSR